ncbi:MAG: L(+)-tartrate dehydratase subunit beta [Clostridiales bacterium]|jgi:L(+)-tartrate dehydratase beta subunit|nr:L(+)-tartrate dehydratase subunit beta [Clostridiales bacterium]
MQKKILTTPITDDMIKDIRIGDIIYLTGIVGTARDDGHRRVVEGNRLPDFDLTGTAVMHVGPIVLGDRAHGFEIIAAGPTTSRRMERYEKEFIQKTGVKLIIGKGGMGEKTTAACKEFKALHCVYPGGCAVSAATAVERVLGVEWEDFGMPEAFWILKVKELGPLIVSIDTNGNNLFKKNQAVFDKKKEAAIEEVSGHVHYSHK